MASTPAPRAIAPGPVPLFSVIEAAQHLGISRHYLDILHNRGDAPAFVPMGRRRLYTIDDLNAWITARKVAAGA